MVPRPSQSAPSLRSRGGAGAGVVGRGGSVLAAAVLTLVAVAAALAMLSASRAARLLGGDGVVVAIREARPGTGAGAGARPGLGPGTGGDAAAASPAAAAAGGGGGVSSGGGGDGDAPLFTPELFLAGRASGRGRDGYRNLPAVPFAPELERRVRSAVDARPSEPHGLLHEAHPPGHDAVMGLAAYPNNMAAFQRIVGGLRNVGYDGHIILGVHAQIPTEEREYLERQDATFYAVEMVECDPSILDEGAKKKNKKGGGNVVRGKCSRGLEDLKLEWGRFEMARQWLHKCAECTGWALVMDTRDIFFQSHPFTSLPDPSKAEKELLFVEEVSRHSSPLPPEESHRYYVIDNMRYKGKTEPCYGQNHWREYGDRPVLCSGTVLGTRAGMHRFLSVLVDEFRSNNRKRDKPECRSPRTTDQWTMNYLYYRGRFGHPDRTATLPWGTGPVLTIGHPCSNPKAKRRVSQRDMAKFENDDAEGGGWILNNWEADGGPARRAPAVHQFDRCRDWMGPWLERHKDLYETERAPPWKKEE